MWSKRAYVHWIVGCGISEDSLHEAKDIVINYLKEFPAGPCAMKFIEEEEVFEE